MEGICLTEFPICTHVTVIKTKFATRLAICLVLKCIRNKFISTYELRKFECTIYIEECFLYLYNKEIDSLPYAKELLIHNVFFVSGHVNYVSTIWQQFLHAYIFFAM